jgi:hypothetical protein
MGGKSIVTATAAACLAVFSLPAFATPTVSAQTAPGVNFGAYRTYTWAPRLDADANPPVYVAIISDVDSVLSQNGYQRVDSNGEITLVLTLGSHEKSDVQTWGWWGQQISVYDYVVGQLAIDALDTKTQQPLWHGYASETVDPDNPDMDRINEAVYELITQFPPTRASDAPVPDTEQ